MAVSGHEDEKAKGEKAKSSQASSSPAPQTSEPGGHKYVAPRPKALGGPKYVHPKPKGPPAALTPFNEYWMSGVSRSSNVSPSKGIFPGGNVYFAENRESRIWLFPTTKVSGFPMVMPLPDEEMRVLEIREEPEHKWVKIEAVCGGKETKGWVPFHWLTTSSPWQEAYSRVECQGKGVCPVDVHTALKLPSMGPAVNSHRPLLVLSFPLRYPQLRIKRRSAQLAGVTSLQRLRLLELPRRHVIRTRSGRTGSKTGQKKRSRSLKN